MEPKKFGLLLPKKKDSSKMKKKSVFDSSSDEETSRKKRPKIPQSKPSSSKCIKSEVIDDPSIYEYDNIYDEMKEKQKAEILPKEKKTSRYIDTLLKAADKRKKQYERRVEKKVQLEREKEGDKFKDKEAFVTSAYKKKMQEMEEEEERERRESLINDMMDVTKQKDLSGFYRHFLNQTIGDEKIPTNDKLPIKKEPLSEDEVDSARKSDSDNRSPHQKQSNESKIQTIKDENYNSKGTTKSRETNDVEFNKKQKRILRQRHDSSSSSEETNGGKSPRKSDDQNHRKRIAARKSYRKRNKSGDSKSSSDESVNLEKAKMTENNSCEKQKKHHISIDADSSDTLSKNNSCEKRKKHHKSIDADSSDNLSENDTNADKIPEHANSNEKDNALVNSEVNESRSDDKEAKQRDLFKKRTVGSVFDEAQARYFMRLAARSGTE